MTKIQKLYKITEKRGMDAVFGLVKFKGYMFRLGGKYMGTYTYDEIIYNYL